MGGVDLAGWASGFDDMFAVVAARFSRRESRFQARAYLEGLLSEVERKNSWQLAEFAGDASADGMQRLLGFYRWSADEVRDDLRGYVAGHLGEPGGVLVADETGFIKKGTASAGVQRQYTGTSGKIDNCQIGVFLAYVSSAGRALVDRELYLPESWIADRERCEAAGIDDGVGFTTKPELAWRMVERAMDAGVPFAWFTADEAYGDNPGLRAKLEDARIAYVMAVSRDTSVPAGGGAVLRADHLAAALPEAAWQVLSCGDGAKGERLYAWALIETGPYHGILVRKSLTSGEKAFYRCHTPNGAALRELVAVAGARWGVEECFQSAKNETGLDHYQVRHYQPWYRHITLAMLAHAYLAVTAHQAQKGTRRLWTTTPEPAMQ